MLFSSRSTYGLGPVPGNKVAFILLAVILFAFSIGAAEAKPIRILVLGDSLTAGYNLPQEHSFPAQLEEALRAEGYEVEVLNAGVSGDTTAGGRARLDWALSDDPDMVILALGGNDGLRAISPEETRANLAAMLERLKEEDLPVLLVGMKAPPNLGKDYSEAFNAIYPELAQQYGVALYPFFLEGVAAEPDLNQQDGIHPTAEGIAVIVERMLPYVVRILKTT